MKKISWKSDYSVSSKYLDDQHQCLLMIINDFIEAVSKGKGTEKAFPILNRLTQYAEEHFRDEEHLMNAARFPQGMLKEHMREHEKLTEDIFAICAHLNKSGEETLPEISQFLKHWLLGHILTTDKEYSKYVANIDDSFMYAG
ncbi:MAG: bacteriohemerythrin [Desulfobulbaceae bacterium]|nr:bacteriohemerythrin [Desulfobulbaceae bacterium]